MTDVKLAEGENKPGGSDSLVPLGPRSKLLPTARGNVASIEGSIGYEVY